MFVAVSYVAGDHAERQGAKKRGIVRLPRLRQFGINGEGLVRASKADITLQGEAEEFFGRCRIWRKISVERCDFRIITCLEEGGGFRFNCRRCSCGGSADRRSNKQHDQPGGRDRNGSQVRGLCAQQPPVRSLEPRYHVAGMRTVAARYIRLT